MIRALRLFSRLAVVALALWLFAAWMIERTEPPQFTTTIEGEIDHILIEKQKRRMTLYQNGQAVRIYSIALGFAPAGDKVREGDGKTPEGMFEINRRNPKSAFTLSLGINYPTPDDVKRARAGGYSAGGDIFLHGQPNRLPDSAKANGDWTAGCIALTNAEIREIWAVTPIGTSVEIKS